MEANVQVRRTLSGRKIPPIKEVFFSKPFLANMATHVGYNWGFYTLLTGTPLFLNNILHYSIADVSMNERVHCALIENGFPQEWISFHSSVPGHVPDVIPSRNSIRLPGEHGPPLNHSNKENIPVHWYNRARAVHDWPGFRGLQQHPDH